MVLKVDASKVLNGLEMRMNERINTAYSDMFTEVNNSLKRIFKDGLQQAMKSEILDVKRYLETTIQHNQDFRDDDDDSNPTSKNVKGIKNEHYSEDRSNPRNERVLTNLIHSYGSRNAPVKRSENSHQQIDVSYDIDVKQKDGRHQLTAKKESQPNTKIQIKQEYTWGSNEEPSLDTGVNVLVKSIEKFSDMNGHLLALTQDNIAANEDKASSSIIPTDGSMNDLIEVLKKKKLSKGKLWRYAKCKICSKVCQLNKIKVHVRRKHRKMLASEVSKNVTPIPKSTVSQPEGLTMMEKIERMKELVEVLSQTKTESGKLHVEARCKVCKVREGRIDLVRKHIRRCHPESLNPNGENKSSSDQNEHEPKAMQTQAYSSEEVIAKLMEYVEILERYKTPAGHSYTSARCKICQVKTGRVDEVRKHVKNTHKDVVDITDSHKSNNSAYDQTHESEIKRSNGRGQLSRTELISLFVERLDKKEKIGDRIVPFSRCKECSFESRNDNIRRHIRKKHAKLIARKMIREFNPTSNENSYTGTKRGDPELTVKTVPFIEILSKERYPTTGKVFTMAKCKLCPRTARIDRVRRHVVKEHNAEMNGKQQESSPNKGRPEDNLEITIDVSADPKSNGGSGEHEQISEVYLEEELQTVSDVTDFVEVLNKILSRCKICSKAASEEEIKKHVLMEHPDALENMTEDNTQNVNEVNKLALAEDQQAMIEKFAESVEPRIFGNEKNRRTCFKCTICDTVHRKDRIGRHLIINHKDHIANN